MSTKNILIDNELFIIDLDGVVYQGNTPLPNAIESINRLYSNGKSVVFFTNNTTLTPGGYKNKLEKMGIFTETSSIFTSAIVCANALRNIHTNDRTVFVIGEEGLFNALVDAGFSIENNKYTYGEIVNNKSITTSLVVAGLDRSISYDKLAAASILISRGAKFYASNADQTLPYSSGVVLPGSGSIIAFITTASNIKPEKIFGKPYPYGIRQILKIFRCPPSKAVIVGDRLDTDILCGKRAKVNTAIVLTGITQMGDIQILQGKELPDYILNNLSEMFSQASFVKEYSTKSNKVSKSSKIP